MIHGLPITAMRDVNYPSRVFEDCRDSCERTVTEFSTRVDQDTNRWNLNKVEIPQSML